MFNTMFTDTLFLDFISSTCHDGDVESFIDKSLDLEKSQEEMTPYFLARSRK